MILIIGTAAGVILLRNNRNPSSQAATDCTPGSVQIANITDKSVDISFSSNSTCITTLSVNSRLIQDARQTGTSVSFSAKTHYFMVDGLQANTTYAYTLISGSNSYTNANYKFKTASTPQSAIPTSNLAWGRIYKTGKVPAATAIIYIDIPGASPLSSFVTANGNWNISLANSFNSALTSWFIITPDSDENITVISENQNPLLLTGNTTFNNPVPDIILDQTKTLVFNKTTPTPLPTATSIPLPTSPLLYRDLLISSPKEGETIPDVSAQFIGYGSPNSTVSLLLQTSPVQKTTLTTTNDGSWSWSLPQKLAIGKKTLIANSGSQTTTRIFYVSNKISSPAFVASPSAKTTLIPTPLPTDIPTSIPTVTPKPTRVSQPSTSSGVPVTGYSLPTILISTIGIVATTIALLLFR